ncbi:probable O-methyltransferase 3 [Rhodamnia argentea]|uniref:Probable O-methyltransferase 3 n=1 Tax=Rhodamnia argentea TaxID=178133 RepID=A0A8B8N6Y2_9MYRT|nr:probable O-methyltransferase 3 [Rhodamnia argentea]
MDRLSSFGATKEILQAQSHLYNLTSIFVSSMSLKCAVQLCIPDAINDHKRPITLLELALALRIHPSKTTCLHRLMRVLVHLHKFTETLVPKHGGGREEVKASVLTPSSSLLLSDKATGLSPFIVAMLDPALVTPWHFLGDWFPGNHENSCSNKLISPFEAAHGLTLWDYGRKNPEFSDALSGAMAIDSQMMNVVMKDCKHIFQGLDTLVDVGGGTGTVLDLPHVVAGLPESENVKFVGADVFEFIPPWDAILLKLILHNWSDEDCVKVLRKCRKAIAGKNNERGKVIIIDMVIGEDKDDDAEATATKLFFNMLMMTVVTGRERTKKEWDELSWRPASDSTRKLFPGT